MATHSLLLPVPAIGPRRGGTRDAAVARFAGEAVGDDLDCAGGSDTESDEALVHRAQSGEREALVVVYRRYVNEIFGFAYRQLGDAQDAEDVTSETFLRLVSALDGFDHRASFRTWLYAVARNQLRDRWRQRGRQPTEVQLEDAEYACNLSAFGDSTHEAFAPVDTFDDEAVDEVVDAFDDHADDPFDGFDAAPHSPMAALGRQVMAALPAHYRTVLTLRIAHGRSIRDVAEAMQTTPGNVKVLQHRALKRAAAAAAALAATGAPDRAPTRS